MSGLDSLIGLLELRKADGLVLIPGESPAVLGGRDRALTMPPLDAATVTGFLEELFSSEQRAAITAGDTAEAEYRSARSGTVVAKARLESGRIRLVIRRGVLRGARPPPITSSGASASPPQMPMASPPPPVTAPAATIGVAPAAPEAPTVAAPAASFAASEPLLPSSASLAAAASGAGLHLVAEPLERAIAEHASDLILASGAPPVLKLRGEAVRLDGPALDERDLLSVFEGALGADRRRRLDQTGSVDLGLDYQSPNRARPVRLRVNVFRRHGGLTAVLRPIWDEVPSLDALGLPRVLRRVVESPHGLVLFAGPTGSGKSTTLAALMEIVNETRACHVLTLEDPIEYVFPPGRAVVHQREVGTHVSSFADGLRAALRESPDVILLGEMRDPETIALALTAAETGHLVLSTIHAGSAMGALERVVNALPEVERSALRVQLAGVLRHVVVQRLLPGAGGGRVPAIGILAVNHAVASLIREGRTQLVGTQMEIGAEEGMVTLEAALAALVRSGRISRDTALGATTQRDALEALLADRGGLPRLRSP